MGATLQIEEKFAIPFGAQQWRHNSPAHPKAARLCGGADLQQHLIMLLGMAHDSAFADCSFADFELWFHQGDDIRWRYQEGR
jgi:hypothetical protein